MFSDCTALLRPLQRHFPLPKRKQEKESKPKLSLTCHTEAQPQPLLRLPRLPPGLASTAGCIGNTAQKPLPGLDALHSKDFDGFYANQTLREYPFPVQTGAFCPSEATGCLSALLFYHSPPGSTTTNTLAGCQDTSHRDLGSERAWMLWKGIQMDRDAAGHWC